MTESSTRTLAGALDALRSAADAAGLDPEAAVREGEALAAAVAESAEQGLSRLVRADRPCGPAGLLRCRTPWPTLARRSDCAARTARRQ